MVKAFFNSGTPDEDSSNYVKAVTNENELVFQTSLPVNRCKIIWTVIDLVHATLEQIYHMLTVTLTIIFDWIPLLLTEIFIEQRIEHTKINLFRTLRQKSISYILAFLC